MTYAQVSGDTAIDGIACSKINRIKYSKNEFPDHHTDIDTLIRNAIYVYDNEDTVFVYNENVNRFTPLYVFNVSEGDTVCLPVIGADRRPNPIAGGDTCFCFVIDSVRTVLYDTTYLETFFEHSLADTDSQSPDIWYNDTWPVYNWSPSLAGNAIPSGAYTRKTGGLFGGLIPTHNAPGVGKPTNDTLHYDDRSGLRCYADDSLAIHILQSGENCYFEEATGIRNIQPRQNLLTLFPNPTTGLIRVKSQIPIADGTRVYITDISGRIL